MLYALFEIVEGLNLTPQSIGEQLQESLEEIGIQTSLPTSADWGYVFRLNIESCSYDISIIQISKIVYGLAIEAPRDIISRLFNMFKSSRVKATKEWISEILGLEIGVVKENWYTQANWISTFGKDFWGHVKS
jgi:hypothetical protein